MSSATAAVPARVGLIAVFLATLAFLFATPADGGSVAWNAYLAPVSACPGSTSAHAAAPAQRRVVTCLINWARKRAGRAKLAPSTPLARAASLKGQKVASCGELSHTPCGSEFVGPLNASGYRYASFGENLFAGPAGGVTPRAVVAAWLESSGHRENVLRPYFRDLGTTFVQAHGLFNDGPEVVWVATFGSRR